MGCPNCGRTHPGRPLDERAVTCVGCGESFCRAYCYGEKLAGEVTGGELARSFVAVACPHCGDWQTTLDGGENWQPASGESGLAHVEAVLAEETDTDGDVSVTFRDKRTEITGDSLSALAVAEHVEGAPVDGVQTFHVDGEAVQPVGGCPECGGTAVEVHYERAFTGETIAGRTCQDCGEAFSKPYVHTLTPEPGPDREDDYREEYVAELARFVESLPADVGAVDAQPDADVDVDRLAAGAKRYSEAVAEHVPAMMDALVGADDETVAAIFAILANVTQRGVDLTSDYLPECVAALVAEDPRIRASAAVVLHHLREYVQPTDVEAYLPDLLGALEDSERYVRGAAVELLLAVESDCPELLQEHVGAVVAALDGVPAQPLSTAAGRLGGAIAREHPDVADRLTPQLVDALDAHGIPTRVPAFAGLGAFARVSPDLVTEYVPAIVDSEGFFTAIERLDHWENARERRDISALVRLVADHEPGAVAEYASILVDSLDDDQAVRENVAGALALAADHDPDCLADTDVTVEDVEAIADGTD